jgi:hypothetical protein
MSTKLTIPGDSIEKNAFLSSVIAVETAVPVFIGYTEKLNGMESPYRINQHVPRLLNIQNVSVVHFMLNFSN